MTYDDLPPPPDGYGPWHAHDTTGIEENDHPEELYGLDHCYYVMRGHKPTPTAVQVKEAIWHEYSEESIAFFCLPHDHPFNHMIPEPKPVHIDTAGMETNPLWGAF